MSYSEPEYKNSDTEDYKVSEYVRLEADFFEDLYYIPSSEEPDETSLHQRTILVVSLLHHLLNDIVIELQHNLGDSVTVLSASDSQSVQSLLKCEDIELVLYNSGPGDSGGSSILKTLHSDGNFNLISTYILLRKSRPDLKKWLQNPMQSKHIMKAINQLNELS